MSNYKEKLKEVVCLIKFIIIVDNKGHNIYSRYYSDEFEGKEYQKEFEEKICLATKNINNEFINKGKVNEVIRRSCDSN